jgi:hypothetical protein
MIGGTIIWYMVDEKLPEINEKNWFKHNCIVATQEGKVMSMAWTKNIYASTEKGQRPRWEWNGRVSIWTVVAWAELPAHPFPKTEGEKK